MQSWTIKIVYSLVLMVQSLMQTSPPETLRLKHADHHGVKFDKAMVEFSRNRTG